MLSYTDMTLLPRYKHYIEAATWLGVRNAFLEAHLAVASAQCATQETGILRQMCDNLCSWDLYIYVFICICSF